MMPFPFVSAIIFVPFFAALLILVMPQERKAEIKVIAAVAALTSLLLALWVFIAYDRVTGGYQFEEQMAWLPALGSSYHVGVSGMSAPLLLLGGLLLFSAVLISWNIEDRTREFFAFLLLIGVGVFGAFAMLDLFMLLLFYELVLFPIYLLIAYWGWRPLLAPPGWISSRCSASASTWSSPPRQPNRCFRCWKPCLPPVSAA